MKSEHEDPNNHVPKISDDDDWDDLDSDSSPSTSQLPPRRADHGIPPKKESKRLNVRLHEPRVKLEPETSGPVFPKKDSAGDVAGKGGVDSTEEAVVEKAVSSKKASKRTAKKAAEKAAKKNAGQTTEKKTAGKTPAEEDGASELGDSGSATESGHAGETSEDTRTRLPVASVGRLGKFRVNTIGSSDVPLEGAQRVPKMTPAAVTAGKCAEMGQVSEWQRGRFVRGERSDWGDNEGRGSLWWMLGSGVGIIMIVILAVFLSQRGGRGNAVGLEAVVPMDEISAKASEAEAARMKALERLTNSQEEARELYGRFETAGSAAELSDILFNREENLSLLEKHRKPPSTDEGWTPDESSLWKIFEEEDESYGVLEGTRRDFTEFTAFFRMEDGALKLDWRATTGYGTASLEELGRGVGNGEEIRGRLSPSDFYVHPFSEEEYSSFRLLPPGDGRTIWAYAKRESEVEGRLSKLFTPSEITGEVQSEAKVVLTLVRGPEASLPNQWIISDIRSLNWLEK